MEMAFLGIFTNNRKPLQEPGPTFKIDTRLLPLIQQFLTFTFVGDPSEIKASLNEFVDESQIDELIIVSHIYDHKARLNSYKILKDLQKDEV